MKGSGVSKENRKVDILRPAVLGSYLGGVSKENRKAVQACQRADSAVQVEFQKRIESRNLDSSAWANVHVEFQKRIESCTPSL